MEPSFQGRDRIVGCKPRRRACGTPPSPEGDVDWRQATTFSTAKAPEALLDFAAAALRAEGLELVAAPVLVRHGPGDRGLPAFESGTRTRFSIDLTEARRTLDGGLLLFSEDGARLTGWRAERGTMTLWNGDDPDLTELAPGAPERVTLVGAAKAV